MAKVFFVATPIGNLGDISFRAIETLNNADVILCEDTRHSKILLDRYEISKPLKSFHKFNEVKTLDYVCNLVREGKNVAVVSDAGMPCISDPGYLLVQRLIDEGLDIPLFLVHVHSLLHLCFLALKHLLLLQAF